jgi:hypothetical protein
MSQSTDDLTQSELSHPRPLPLYDQPRRTAGLPGDGDLQSRSAIAKQPD